MSNYDGLLEKRKPETLEEVMDLYERLENKKINLLANCKKAIVFSMQNLIDLFSVIKKSPDSYAKKRVESFFKMALGEEECMFLERRAEEYIK